MNNLKAQKAGRSEAEKIKEVVLDPALQRLPAFFAHGPILLLSALTLVPFLYLLLPTVDITLNGIAVIQSDAPVLRLSAAGAGFVEKSYVSRGQSVEAGTPLLLFTYLEPPPEPLDGDEQAARTAQLRAELEKLDSEQRRNIRERQLKARQDELELESLKRDISYWETQEQTTAAEFENIKRLYERRLVSMGEFNSNRSNLERTRTELIKLKARSEILADIAANSAEDLKKAEADYKAAREKLEKQIEELLKVAGPTFSERQSGPAENQVVIRARQAGTVSYLPDADDYSFVPTGGLLYELLTPKSRLTAAIALPRPSAAVLRPDQPVRYHFGIDTPPSRALVGRLLTVAHGTDLDQPYLLLSGSLEQNYYYAGGRRQLLRPDLSGEVEIVIGRSSLLSHLWHRGSGSQ